MDKTTAQRIAQRFVGLPLEQRRQILQKMSETGQSFRLLPIAETRHDVARIPLSYAQQQMLILWQLDPDNSAYNVPMAVRLTGTLDEQAMSRALVLLVHRHATRPCALVSFRSKASSTRKFSTSRWWPCSGWTLPPNPARTARCVCRLWWPLNWLHRSTCCRGRCCGSGSGAWTSMSTY